ncbi:MAG TPA: PD-(D/E)XK nuclease family protein [Nocardioidaceae bacterium]|nr:PD-(D/E)XK nuclease family protein [Nocardioidaceae bacterium]
MTGEAAHEQRRLVDGLDVLGSLSPSRAAEFLTCPLRFRFRTVDRLPEPLSTDAVRGTLVHKVLEDLFDLPADERTPARAVRMVEPAWAALTAAEPEVARLFQGGPPAEADTQEGSARWDAWLASCKEAVARYFTLEDPTRLEPAERETYVEAVLSSRLLLRGFVDRLDINPAGDIRVVDYKTGKAPGEGFEARALFQLRFYALVLWRTRGVVPRMLQLVYLGSGEVLRYTPDESDLRATERKIEAVWEAIRTAQESGDWRPRRSSACEWCPHRSRCPEWGGTPPPLPEVTTGDVVEVLTGAAPPTAPPASGPPRRSAGTPR